MCFFRSLSIKMTYSLCFVLYHNISCDSMQYFDYERRKNWRENQACPRKIYFLYEVKKKKRERERLCICTIKHDKPCIMHTQYITIFRSTCAILLKDFETYSSANNSDGWPGFPQQCNVKTLNQTCDN